MLKIAPSILSADFAVLGADCQRVIANGADALHIDVMDGHFVPNISLGLPVLKSLKNAVDAVYDVHLMISEPQKYALDFIKCGADILTFHIEALTNPVALIDLIHKNGAKAGISIKPKTAVADILPLLSKVDLVLVMTVEPGFGGQSFMPCGLEKIKQLSLEKKKNGYDYIIEVDGGINEETASQCAENGAEMLVAGSYVFGNKDIKTAIDTIKNADS